MSPPSGTSAELCAPRFRPLAKMWCCRRCHLQFAYGSSTGNGDGSGRKFAYSRTESAGLQRTSRLGTLTEAGTILDEVLSEAARAFNQTLAKAQTAFREACEPAQTEFLAAPPAAIADSEKAHRAAGDRYDQAMALAREHGARAFDETGDAARQSHEEAQGRARDAYRETDPSGLVGTLADARAVVAMQEVMVPASDAFASASMVARRIRVEAQTRARTAYDEEKSAASDILSEALAAAEKHTVRLPLSQKWPSMRLRQRRQPKYDQTTTAAVQRRSCNGGGSTRGICRGLSCRSETGCRSR